jgi:hypothetical protein
MQKELGEAIDMELVKAEINKHFEAVFEAELI